MSSPVSDFFRLVASEIDKAAKETRQKPPTNPPRPSADSGRSASRASANPLLASIVKEQEARIKELEKTNLQLAGNVNELGNALTTANAALNGGFAPGYGLRGKIEELENLLADAQRQQESDTKEITRLRGENDRLRTSDAMNVQWREDPRSGQAYYARSVYQGREGVPTIEVLDIMGGHRIFVDVDDWIRWNPCVPAGAPSDD